MMSSSSSSSLKEETTTATTTMEKKQGIVSILGGCDDSEIPKNYYQYSPASNSLRRTLSADMSSLKWQSQCGFSPLKRVASSSLISDILDSPSSSSSSSSSSDGEAEEYGGEKGGKFEAWSSIQEEADKDKIEKSEKIGSFDALWNSILSQKKQQQEDKEVPPPYVHPLVKRSASSLSGKSLETCTESLGSETGSDGFSFYSPSETSDAEDVQEDQEQQQQPATRFLAAEDFQVVKYNNLSAANSKKSSPRSFPPPIPSLSNRDGAPLRMRSHRDNGRLVLEAVSVPSMNNFHAERKEGRLVLSFINAPNQEEEEEEEAKIIEGVHDHDQFEVEIEQQIEPGENEDIDEEDVGEEGGICCCGGGSEEEVRYVMEAAPKLSSGVISVHRLALVMNKPMVLANRNPMIWSNKVNLVNGNGGGEEEEEVEEGVVSTITPVAQSLPPLGRNIPSQTVAEAAANEGGASFNVYEYYWKPKTMGPSTILDQVTKKSMPIKTTNNDHNKLIVFKNLMPNEQQELVVMRGNRGDYFVPLIEGCKVEKRSLGFWEPYCIATS